MHKPKAKAITKTTASIKIQVIRILFFGVSWSIIIGSIIKSMVE